MPHYVITVPPGASPGIFFSMSLEGKHLQIECPENTRPGHQILIHIPPPSTLSESSSLYVNDAQTIRSLLHELNETSSKHDEAVEANDRLRREREQLRQEKEQLQFEKEQLRREKQDFELRFYKEQSAKELLRQEGQQIINRLTEEVSFYRKSLFNQSI